MLWLIFGVLIMATLAILLFPFLRDRTSQTLPRADYDMVIYRSQLAEVDAEVERGLLTEDEAKAVRAEVYRRMLAAEDAEWKDPTPDHRADNRRVRGGTALAVAAAVSLGAIVFYSMIGSPNLIGKPYAWRQLHDPDFTTDAAAEKLAQLLKTSPNVAGYERLGRMYFDTRHFHEAAASYRRAIALGATDADSWSELGEAVVMSNSGAVVPEALLAFTNALGNDPKNARARFYIGLAESQIGNLKQAVAIWRDLERDSDQNAPWLALVREQITNISAQGGFDAASIRPSPPNVQAMNVALTAMTNALHVQGSSGMAGSATPQVRTNAGPTMVGTDKDTMIRAMVAHLAAKLEANPDDVQGWQRLSRAYVVQGEAHKAVEAAERAVRLKPNDAGVLLSLAEAERVSTPADDAPPAVVATMRRVLALEPTNAQALYVVGVAEQRAGRTGKARAMWHKALTSVAPDDPLASVILGRLKQ